MCDIENTIETICENVIDNINFDSKVEDATYDLNQKLEELKSQTSDLGHRLSKYCDDIEARVSALENDGTGPVPSETDELATVKDKLEDLQARFEELLSQLFGAASV